ncbi:hypothetical protein ABTF39_21475, partial [Acinetobacter baumannii]
SVPARAAALQAAEAARQPAITVMRIIFFIVVSECLVQTVETIQTAKQFIKFIKSKSSKKLIRLCRGYSRFFQVPAGS